jgi:hypothetical protein
VSSARVILTTHAVVTALVMLAGRLPGHAKLDGDLRPADPEIHGVVDQLRQIRLCLLLCDPGELDFLQQLRGRGICPCLAGWVRGWWGPPWLRPLRVWT